MCQIIIYERKINACLLMILLIIVIRNIQHLDDKCGNGVCSHPTGKCSGSCYNLLLEIHYFDGDKCKHKSLYDCQKVYIIMCANIH